MKFTFDLSKCDRIFDELLKFGYIKMSHTLPSIEELKRRSYCKFHNSFSMRLMIAMFSVGGSNRVSTRDK
jgi:hypothetical protein